jgi:hypothetical protein
MSCIVVEYKTQNNEGLLMESVEFENRWYVGGGIEARVWRIMDQKGCS